MGVIEFLSNLIVGVIIARMTVHFTSKSFYSEKWWEKKAEAYEKIIESLHLMKNYTHFHIAYEGHGSELPDSFDKELIADFERAHAEVRKRADVGIFVICEGAVQALQLLEKELDNAKRVTGWAEHLILEHDAIEKCLISLREISVKDIGMRK